MRQSLPAKHNQMKSVNLVTWRISNEAYTRCRSPGIRPVPDLRRPGRAQSPTPPTPTTRILAIGTVNPGADVAAARAVLPMEVRETVKLYLDGKIDQWYSLQNRAGVAFILNVTDIAAAHDVLEKLPLGKLIS
ncbi:hypothetical protein ACQ5SK_30295 [Bradyrhizobium japonicum]